MQLRQLPLDGLALIDLPTFHDSRGFFIERYQEEKFRALGLPTHFMQDNHSRSLPGVLRGLHYQHSPGQGKLVSCLTGTIWDVAVDIRKHSPTFGQHFALELTEERPQLFWIPTGFAHGFVVISDKPADVFYKVDSPYTPHNEGSIIWNDPQLRIAWPTQSPHLSQKDQNAPSFSDYAASPKL